MRSRPPVCARSIAAPADRSYLSAGAPDRGRGSDRRYSRRSASLLFASLLATFASLAAFALFATPALAGSALHKFSTTFAGSGTNALSNPTDVAVDNSSGSSAHDIYVTDPANHRIEKFTPSGEFVLMFGKDVNETTAGNVCTAVSGNTCKAGISGTSPGEFQTPTFVAVDSSSGLSSGDVYVGDTGADRIFKFDSSGNLITSWGTGGQLPTSFSSLDGIVVDPSGNLFVLTEESGKEARWYEQDGTLHSTFGVPRGTSPAGLAVDAEDHLYKVDGEPVITKFTDTGEGLGEPDTKGSTRGLTVDPATNDLYAVEGGSSIDRFRLNCGQGCGAEEEFGSGHLNGAEGIATDAALEDIYVANTSGGDVAVFFTPILPKVTTESATEQGLTSATLHGHLDPNGGGNVTECYFEWGLRTFYHNTVPCDEGDSFSAPASVHADLIGLTPGTTYHYRIVAANAEAANSGEDQTFTTLGTAPDRIYSSHIAGLGEPISIAIDSANQVWIGHTPPDSVSEYGPFPSQSKIGEQTGEGSFSTPEHLATDSSNESLYVGEYGPGLVDEFDSAGNLVLPQWAFGNFSVEGLAADNSGGESNGRIYVATSSPGGLKAFDPGQVPADFSASESYIDGNQINASGGHVAVDTSGNIYITVGPAVVEYRSSGEFVQTFGGSEVPGGLNGLVGIAIDPTSGNLLLVSNNAVDEFSPTGEYISQVTGPSPTETFGNLTGAIAVNSDGYLYVGDGAKQTVDIFTPRQTVPRVAYSSVSHATPTAGTLNASVEPGAAGEEVTTCRFEYGTTTSSEKLFSLGQLPCHDSGEAVVGTPSNPITSQTAVHVALAGLTTDTTYYYRVVVGNVTASRPGLIQSFTPRAVQGLQTEPATHITATSAELNGSFEGLGEDTKYYFQYGSDTSYGQSTEIENAGEPNGPNNVEPALLTGLQPAATYHYRIVATNGIGTTYGADRTFTTLTRPSVDGLFSSSVTATTAVLHATINPQGAATTYRFEYGPNTLYGNTTPLGGEEITENLTTDHSVEVDLTGLQSDVTYHFRVVAESPYGTTESEDQTFGFHPPSCPNAHLRQITHSSNLPDCRAYELVSPSNAGGTSLYPQGPNSPTALTHFAFGGVFGAIPGAGEAPDTAHGDLYVATRTDEGWVTKYVGLSASATYGANGPPDELRSARELYFTGPAGTRTESNMDRFIDWNDGIPVGKGGGLRLYPPQFQPYVWAANGDPLEEWPNAAGYTPSEASPIFEQSADFSHYVFQTGSTPTFSLMDDNTVAHTAVDVSIESDGQPIPIQPGDTTPDRESLRVPAVSSDGSHILIAARAEPGAASGPEGQCGLEKSKTELEGNPDQLCPLQPSQLYMRINDMVTFEIAPGHAVTYVTDTPDGSRVYFTSAEHLTGETLDHGGSSLYMWNAVKAEDGEQPLTLISKGDNKGNAGEPGNTANCTALWTTECAVAPFVNNSYHETESEGYVGGNGLSDNSVAAENGDIYFFSPEQLAGPRGVRDQENLYDYRNGEVQYVTTFTPQPFCAQAERLDYCSAGPVIRMQVSPDDTHMAFLTADRVTPYNNHGYTEMYTYDPSDEEMKCVSCLPNGLAPTTNVFASSNGLFMTNDGRTFFSTGDALVPQDTDGLRDVYEYVEGHAQLISSGTSSKDEGDISFFGNAALFNAGLAGVSANGTNVFFSTYDTLVGQDHNGVQLKFYDARTDGGFPYSAPVAGCEAADECHGEGSAPEAAIHNGSGAELGSEGNVSPKFEHPHHSHRRKRREHGRERHHRDLHKSGTGKK